MRNAERRIEAEEMENGERKRVIIDSCGRSKCSVSNNYFAFSLRCHC